MENLEKQYQLEAERGGAMTKLTVFSLAAAGVFAVVSLCLGTIWDQVAGSDSFSLGFPVFLTAAIFSTAALVYGLLSRAANREEVDKLELEKRKGAHHAFEVNEDVRFTSGRAFANYRKYAPPVFSVLAAGLLILLLSSYAVYWRNPARIKADPHDTMEALVVSVLMMALSAFIGAFFVGQARTRSFRWLRAVGGWFMVGFLVMLAAAAELCLRHFGISGFEAAFSWTIWSILLVLAVELVVNFVVDFYRPRTLEEARPVFESNLLSLFTEPGGVMRNVAETLDYQFGFKVSGTYIYRFIERALFPAVMLWLLMLWLFTCIDQVGADELGLRMRFGKLVSEKPLAGDIYFKLPWPFETIERYSCTEIKTVVVGDEHHHDEPEEEEHDHEHDDGHGHGHSHGPDKAAMKKLREEQEQRYMHVAFWDMHEHENGGGFMLTDRSGSASGSGVDLPVNIAFVNVTAPVQYRIRESELLKYALHNSDPDELLELISEAAVWEYLASCDPMEVLASGRSRIEGELQLRIQQNADALDLGVEIVNVSLLDVHPAPAVVPSYRSVISAQEEMRTSILAAELDRERTVPAAEAYANELTSMAEAYSSGQKLIAAADAVRFNKQLTAYRTLPELFKLRGYLDVLENETSGVRKFIISSSLKQEVYEFNFEENVNFNFTDMDLGK